MSTYFLVYSHAVSGLLGAGIGICVYAAWPSRRYTGWHDLKRRFGRKGNK